MTCELSDRLTELRVRPAGVNDFVAGAHHTETILTK